MARRSRRTRHETAQATVEFALILPILFTVLWLGVESVLLVRDQTLVTHAAREAARAAAVGQPDDAVRKAAAERSGFAMGSLHVTVQLDDGVVVASVRLSERGRLPLLGRLAPQLEVQATVSMRREPG